MFAFSTYVRSIEHELPYLVGRPGKLPRLASSSTPVLVTSCKIAALYLLCATT